MTRTGGVTVALLGQGDDLDADAHDPRRARRRARRPRVGGRRRLPRGARRAARRRGDAPLPAGPRHADRARCRAASGGASRSPARCSAAPTLLLLDEPTNHLDVEGIDWLARHLAARRGSLVVITHDRWFLDAVCTQTWEVADGDRAPVRGRLRGVRARARRARPPGRGARGPPPAARAQGARVAAARAAGADVQAEVPHRGGQRADRRRARAARPRRAAALRHGAAGREGHRGRGRLGRVRRPARSCAHATWRLGPGDRVAVVGANGSGKTTLVDVLAGDRDAGRRHRRARGDRPARAPRPGHRRDPRAPARARGARGDPRADPRSATGASSPPASWPSASASAATAAARSCATSRAASGGACSSCAC